MSLVPSTAASAMAPLSASSTLNSPAPAGFSATMKSCLYSIYAHAIFLGEPQTGECDLLFPDLGVSRSSGAQRIPRPARCR